MIGIVRDIGQISGSQCKEKLEHFIFLSGKALGRLNSRLLDVIRVDVQQQSVPSVQNRLSLYKDQG